MGICVLDNMLFLGRVSVMSEQQNELRVLVESYEDYLASSFRALWERVPVDPANLEAYSVIGGLLSRQVTLSIELARSPAAWNGHSAPLFLRAQTDLHITLAWILGDLVGRSRQYVLHGLGEEKLIIEQYRREIADSPDGEVRSQMEQIVEAKSAWLSSQRHEWMVEVNLGHWAHLDARTMAIEAECEGLYKFAYKPFSQAAHSMWPHVSIYNCRQCENPLHRYHLIPELIEAGIDPDYLYRSCKYVDRSFEAIARKFEVALPEPRPLQWWDDYFGDEAPPSEQVMT